jgi:hypothetical protein
MHFMQIFTAIALASGTSAIDIRVFFNYGCVQDYLACTNANPDVSNNYSMISYTEFPQKV